MILDQSAKNEEELEYVKDRGRQGNGRQMLTCEESTQKEVQTNGHHSTEKRSYDHLRVVLSAQYDTRSISPVNVSIG
jgi:hypothetical protein